MKKKMRFSQIKNITLYCHFTFLCHVLDEIEIVAISVVFQVRLEMEVSQNVIEIHVQDEMNHVMFHAFFLIIVYLSMMNEVMDVEQMN